MQVVQFLGYLGRRYTPPQGTLIVCLTHMESTLPWVRSQLKYVPTMALCPGRDSLLPLDRLVAYMVVGTPRRLQSSLAQLQSASQTSRWQSDVILVALDDPDDEDGPETMSETMVRDLMGITWSKSWLQTSVVVVTREFGTLYALAPFSNTSTVCGCETPSAVRVAAVRLSDPSSFAALPVRLYGERGVIPRDLGGCIIRATVIVSYRDRCGYTAANELPLESKLVRGIMMSVGQYRNVKVEWRYISDQRIIDYGNGSFSSPLALLATGDTDVVLGTMAMTATRMKYLRATVSFLQSSMRVTARCPVWSWRRPQHPHIWNVVSRNVWRSLPRLSLGSYGFCMVLATACTVALRLAIARVLGPEPSTPWWWLSVLDAEWLDHISKACEVFMQPDRRLYPNALSARVLTGAWLILLLNSNVALKGLLLTESAVQRPVPYPQTMEELLAATPNLTVFSPTESLRYTVSTTGVPLEQVVACESEQDVRQCEDRFASSTSTAAVTASQPTRLKCLRGCRFTLPTVLTRANYVSYVRRTYPLVELLDEAILRLNNGGIIEWAVQQEVALRRYKSARSQSRHRRQRRSGAISWDSFLVLLVGQALASLVFLVEAVALPLAHRLCSRTRRCSRTPPAKAAKAAAT